MSAQPALANDLLLNEAIAAATQSIAPTWPLDRLIAVNPYWGYIDRPFSEAATILADTAGSPMAMNCEYYRQAWQEGRITAPALTEAADELQSTLSIDELVEVLSSDSRRPRPAPLFADVLDSQRDLRHEPAWCDTITHQISQFCAAYFDRDQADWRPEQSGGLYASWRSSLAVDHSVALLMRAPGIPAKASALADDPRVQIERALLQLGMQTDSATRYLSAVLMRTSGWAAWCAYLRWQAQLAGRNDETIVDLLAIRLSWECLLDDGKRDDNSVWKRWQSAWFAHFDAGLNQVTAALAIWQRAEEISYQKSLIARLCTGQSGTEADKPRVQAAFCIDVRSEVFRRHLEAQSPHIQTLGFAGFFGLPISYGPLGTDSRRPQLPGLLSPALAITDSSGDLAVDGQIARLRDDRLRAARSWKTFQATPLSAFVLVESLGLGYLAKLVQRTLPGSKALQDDNSLGLDRNQAAALRPTLDAGVAGGVDGQAQIAIQVLTAMGLTKHFARLVLLVGHGSQTSNNPHRAGLECGACCGQKGDVNARALAGLLNDSAVRQRVREAGIAIPEDTFFVAGLHNTTTEQVVLFDLDRVPQGHGEDLDTIREQLAAAHRATAGERAARLGLGSLEAEPETLTRALHNRANDWAQTRPEWGLANNAAFIVAPRSTTRNINLEGRCFLHDYDHRADPDGGLLEQIMTAPMVVTHWINMQYYASTVDNQRFGSGNKTLHNVVGGRLGVFEGNGGDLRIGLPLQSVHDGKSWQHTPLRLTVVIQAPRDAIARVLHKHDTVRHLVDNQWLYLVCLDGHQPEIYRNGDWHPCR